jgi:hypothetical protein
VSLHSAAGRSAGKYLLVLGLLGTAAWTSRNALVSHDTVADTDQWHQYCSIERHAGAQTVGKAGRNRPLEYTAPQDAVDGLCRTMADNKSLVGGRWRVLQQERKTRGDRLNPNDRADQFRWIIQILSIYWYLASRNASGSLHRRRPKAVAYLGTCAAGRSAGNYLLVLGLLGTAAWTSRNALVSHDTVADTDQWHQYCS